MGESVNWTQNLLDKQFPGVSKLMDPCLGKMHQFEIIQVDKRYIQLLHAALCSGFTYQIWKQVNTTMVLIILWHFM